MGVVVKRLRIGRRRAQVATSSPLELALAPALVDGSWRIPDRFNVTRDFVEVLGRDPKRPALMILGLDGIIEPRTFRQLSEGAARWAHILRSKGIEPGDRVLVLSRLNEDWIDIALGCIKVGAIFAPAPPTLSPHALESRVALTDAALVVAGEESEDAIARMSFTPEVHHVRSGRMRRASDVPDDEPTADTSARDVAFLAWTCGTEGDPKPVAHTHGSLFAARATTERWLEPERGALVWCATGPGSALTLPTIVGAWAHGAEVVLHEGDFHPDERLDLVRRIGPTVLCQSPTEYRALATLRQLARARPPRLHRLLATGDYLEPEVVETFREQWGLELESAYGQAETGIVSVSRRAEEHERESGEIGQALPGHHLAVVDEHGAELPPGVEGLLAIRGRPPTLFAGYWDSPEETKRVFRGDWYLTGDVAVAIRPGVFRFLARSGELITTRGRTFGPYEVERALAEHPAVASCAVVGVRDLERGGQFVRAFVVLEDGNEGSEQLEAELRQFVGESLPEQQVPREIEFVDGLPRSPSGAVRRVELRERPLSGRPLWEAPPTTEPDPEPPATAEPPATHAPVVEPAQPPEARAVQVEPPAPPPPAEEVVAPTAGEATPSPAEHPAPSPEPLDEPMHASVVEEVVEDVVEEVGEHLLATPLPEEPAAALTVDPTEAWSEPAPEPASDPEHVPEPPVAAERPASGSADHEPLSTDEPIALVEPEPPAFVEPEPPAPAPAVEPEPESPPTNEAGAPEASVERTRVGAVTPTPLRGSEPLPDYIAASADEYATRTPPLEPAPPPQAEPPDTEPLPEYIVDPSRRLEVVPEPPAGRAAPSAEPPTPDPLRDHPLAGLARPPVSIPIPSDDEPRPERRRSWRRARATPPSATPPKRGRSEGEPGDEGLETGWMHRLSTRLHAYGMSETSSERRQAEEPAPEQEDETPR
ncbi:MAG: hypothetical protein KatS3mg012_1971 [Gaiellaceae bacterium]|nr:MAG: hypothetical protein KatS3mg012_1971 [Gaiellaceae bacterium]